MKSSIKIFPFAVIKGFSSEENLIQHYYKNPNDTVLAIIFKGNNPKRLDYVIRYHDQYGGRADFLNTGQLYHKKFFQYQQHRGKSLLLCIPENWLSTFFNNRFHDITTPNNVLKSKLAYIQGQNKLIYELTSPNMYIV